MSKRAPAVLAALVLAGCATKPPVVEARQHGPLKAAAFRISGSGEDLAPAERLAAADLIARGFRRAKAGEPADYVVQVTHADRARKVGAFVPREEGGPAWLEQDRRRWSLATGVATLGVTVAETASGQEAYGARAVRSYRKPPVEADLPALVEAALAPLQTTRP